MDKRIRKIFNKKEEKMNLKIAEIEEILEDNDVSISEKVDAIRAILEEVKDELLEVQHSAMTDDLTGLLTKKYINLAYNKVAARIKNENKWLALIIVDIDSLKKINDNYGHLVGTKVIERFSEEIQRDIRKSDFASRYGGDEFAIVCVLKSEKSLNSVLGRLRKNLKKLNFDDKFSVSGTLGYAVTYQGKEEFNKLFEIADKAMYQAKKAKKDKLSY